jgi:hypothetical protein
MTIPITKLRVRGKHVTHLVQGGFGLCGENPDKGLVKAGWRRRSNWCRAVPADPICGRCRAARKGGKNLFGRDIHE